MAKKKKNIVFSTNPDFEYETESSEEQETLPPEEQELYVRMEKKGRGGKTVTLVKEFIGTSDDLEVLAKLIKSKCGTGGSVKDSEIIIQGDRTQKVKEILKKEGYKCK